MNKIRSILAILAISIVLSSCSSSRIGVGFSADKGNFLQRPGLTLHHPHSVIDPETEKGTGAYLEYGWYRIKNKHGYGIDASIHLNGYGDDADGDMFTFQTLQAKYHHALYFPRNKGKVLLSAGAGGGRVKTWGEFYPIATYNVGLELYPGRKQRLYISSRANFIRRLGEKPSSGKKSFGLSAGLGFVLRK